MLQLDQAQGEFVLPQPMPEKLLLVTAGSGITPVIGMLRNLFSRATPVTPDIVLLHSALTRDSVIFGPELRGYAARGLIRLVELHTDVDGLLDVVDLEKIVPDLDERTRTRAAPSASSTRSRSTTPPADSRCRWSGSAPAPSSPARAARSPSPTAAPSTPTAPPRSSTSAKVAGVLMPSGCRMGICMSCVLPLKEGAVRDLRNGAITTAVPGETGPDGVQIQTCINAAAGACTLAH